MSTALQASIEDNSIPEPNSGCWLWVGSISANGYGIDGQNHYLGTFPTQAEAVAAYRAAVSRLPA